MKFANKFRKKINIFKNINLLVFLKFNIIYLCIKNYILFMSFKILLMIKDKIKLNSVLMFCCMFLFCSITRAQNNNDSSFYVLDNTLITGKDQVFISSNLKINKQKIYVDVNTIFYDSGVVNSEIEYINNVQKNISKNTNKLLGLAQNYKNKKLKEKVSRVININSNSDNFPIGRKKINLLFSASTSISYSNSSKKINIEAFSSYNLCNPIVFQYCSKYNFKDYDKVINCFKINSKLYNRPPPQYI
jgi:hypothetical protein